MIRIIFAITIGVILLLLIILLVTNRLILNRLWKPFYTIMQELNMFNIANKKVIPQIDTKIDKFKRLNTSVANMSTKAKRDYQTLKAFTENTAHDTTMTRIKAALLILLTGPV